MLGLDVVDECPGAILYVAEALVEVVDLKLDHFGGFGLDCLEHEVLQELRDPLNDEVVDFVKKVALEFYRDFSEIDI